MLDMTEDKRFEMRVSGELLARIDAWRHAQADRPPRATAVKRMITMCLEVSAKKNTKPGSKK